MTENSNSEAPPVRVPNVSAGAKSGLDHEVIGANAQAAYDVNQALAAEDTSTDQDSHGLEVPAGTLEERLAWVSETDDPDERVKRADAIYEHERDSGGDDDHLAKVAAGLREAVYQDHPEDDPTATGDVPDPIVIPEDVPDTVDGLLGWVHEADGHDAQSDRAHAVLDREAERPGDDRVTLVGPLTEEYPRPPAD